MSAEALIDLVAAGHRLLAAERVLFLRGDYDGVARVAVDKTDLIARLETTMRGLRGSSELHRALGALIADSRRNERIILAARAGVTQARRKIASIVATEKGAVAYDRDGSRITSAADAYGKTKRA